MKDTKFSMKKKLFASTSMLVVSAMMLSTATYAWFTMNKEVTITGMEVRTHVGSNLLIQKGALTDTTTLTESGYITDETQEIKAILEPVSTTTAKTADFWYTLDATADGSKLHTPIGGDTAETIAYRDYDETGLATTGNDVNGNAFDSTTYTNMFSQDYGVAKTNTVYDSNSPDKAVGYVDYVFQLKATNTESSAQDINLTKLQLTYDSATDGEKAYRAAVFVSSAVDVGGTFDDWATSALPDANAIYTPSGATNFESGKAVKTDSTRDTVTYTSAATALASVPANSVKYYKVVVRLWIEGEDTTCNTSTFKALTDSWKLDLQMELGQGTGVTNIDMQTTTPAEPAEPAEP